MPTIAEQTDWFRENAHGADRITNLHELIPKLLLMASLKGLDFRKTALRASLWATTHPAKKNYGRFYAGWFGREQDRPAVKQVDWSNPI
jgi:hypothetical protein